MSGALPHALHDLVLALAQHAVAQTGRAVHSRQSACVMSGAPVHVLHNLVLALARHVVAWNRVQYKQNMWFKCGLQEGEGMQSRP